jgi:Plant transposon protein
MIYDAKKNVIASQFFIFSQNVAQKLLRDRKQMSSVKLRMKRSPLSTPRDTKVDFLTSTWGKLLKKLSVIPGGPLITSREGKLFRRRFRVPWAVFIDLLQKCKEKKLFGEHSLKRFDCCGSSICPYAIKLLGVLRILGRNWCCDDVAEATGMGESTIRRGFLEFCSNFVSNYYDAYIYRPVGENLTRMMNIYSRMGLPGCIGSTDCVHLKWDRCPVSLTNLCKGKEGFPTLSYSCTVDHHRRILGVTRSNYGTRNDKTIVRLDTYITDVHDVEFEVFVEGTLVKKTGVYYLCDGGYHKWTCMINPMKHTSCRDDRLWSEWVESTRKDVECVFGKGASDF